VIVDNPENREVDFFQPVNLTCSAIGEPEPSYTWFRVSGYTNKRL